MHRDGNGLVEQVEFTEPPLVAAGQIAQAVGLFDPVGTGAPRDHDRRLPPSVISGFQLTAEDERRNLFQSTAITDAGRTPDSRFLNVTVGGAHSNVGGSYSQNGLAIRSGNIMADYLNALSDTPFLNKREVPTAPEMNVVHRSEEHQFFYRTSVYDRAGARGVETELAPANLCRIDCRDAQPRDEKLVAQFEYRHVPIAAVPGVEATQREATQATPVLQPTIAPGHPDYDLYRSIRDKLPTYASSEIAMHATVEAKREGIWRADQLDKVVVHQGHAFILGDTPGFRTKVDLSAVPPTLRTACKRHRPWTSSVCGRKASC